MLLRDWLEREGKTQDWLGEALGRSQSAVSCWCAGKRSPSHRDQKRIAQLTQGQVLPIDHFNAKQDWLRRCDGEASLAPGGAVAVPQMGGSA